MPGRVEGRLSGRVEGRMSGRTEGRMVSIRQCIRNSQPSLDGQKVGWYL